MVEFFKSDVVYFSGKANLICNRYIVTAMSHRSDEPAHRGNPLIELHLSHVKLTFLANSTIIILIIAIYTAKVVLFNVEVSTYG